MNRIRSNRIIVAVFILLQSFAVKGQISFGGKPVDYSAYPLEETRFTQMPETDMSVKAKSARESSVRLKILEFAHAFPVQFNPYNSGEWRMLPDGRKVWRLGVYSKDAYSLNLLFDKFLLNPGASMFIYTPDRKKIIGSFNHNNNHEQGLAFEPLPGEAVIIELIVPEIMEDFGEIGIASVNHDYLGVFGEKTSMNGNSGRCNVDINCPEGNNHQMDKNSIVKLLIEGSFLCTGALINNTSQDGKPYVLTAHHCIENHTMAAKTVFLFGYEATTCNGTGSSTKSISNSTLRATKKSLDMTLVELSSIPDISYRPYYLGWNRVNSPATSTVGIHHPNGDWKKICKATESPVSVTVQDYSSQAHWWIRRWDIGTTEGGSSGSPLLDSNSRIVGLLTGGFAQCGDPVDDYYAKFSSAWDLFTPASEQLKAWLDPGNTGVTTLNGFNPYQNQVLAADFEIHTTNVCQGEAFVFTDFSRGNVTSYSWNFGAGASPANATGKGPHLVQYSNIGTKTITLEVGDGKSTKSLQRNFTLDIKTTNLPVADFTEEINLRQVTFKNNSQNSLSNYWDFGDGTTSILTNPVKNYNSNGDFPVTLWVRNGPCSDILTRTILKVSVPLQESEKKEFRIYPNPSSGDFTIENDLPVNEGYIEIFSVNGSLVHSEKITHTAQRISLNHVPAGVYLVRMRSGKGIKTGKIIITP